MTNVIAVVTRDRARLKTTKIAVESRGNGLFRPISTERPPDLDVQLQIPIPRTSTTMSGGSGEVRVWLYGRRGEGRTFRMRDVEEL